VSEEQIALARRAVACKGFRWMPGMLTTEGMRVVVRCFNDDNEPDDDIPDLTDPATLGCLLALVREAWVDLHMVAHCDDRYGKTVWWLSRWGDLPRSCECSTEAAALVAALEAAP
jgi:hypothetical protein